MSTSFVSTYSTQTIIISLTSSARDPGFQEGVRRLYLRVTQSSRWEFPVLRLLCEAEGRVRAR